ncbi:MAG: uroporphyrinogen-III synthase, partial [Nitrososphaerota archaeon]|nr:uroporphyrinogen-III synthase [Nitrososphaerota archaeon]
FKPDLSIFTSKTAVKVVFDLISEAWECARSYSIAIGFGTASLLKSLGVRSVDLPSKHNSEGLIQLLKGLSYKSIVVLYCSKNVNNSRGIH